MQTTEVGQNSEIKQVIGSLCMMNNRFMNFMLDDNKKAAQVFLRVILGDDKIKVRNVRIQSFIKNIYGHSSQLDILAQDSKGRYFNVEVQRSDEGAPARRARFYSSILDTHFLQPGKLYEELPDTYVIFITENDVLHDNLPLYNIRRRIDENAKCFEDGSRIIYVNSQRRDNTALGKLMQDLYCTEPKNLHYHEFAERMEFLKYSKEGEEKMTVDCKCKLNKIYQATISVEYTLSRKVSNSSSVCSSLEICVVEHSSYRPCAVSRPLNIRQQIYLSAGTDATSRCDVRSV
ncbi:Rpn family recombination-promoting nuclease/putative transposase, partial [Phascolarctobacterium succinatutens]|uniref:Rpn family recombination-promoting nuclease/putative transposase n=1 Tax=Phascolarctobacterium succinatutens TaxID=626940 RepID=UPI003AB1E96D